MMQYGGHRPPMMMHRMSQSSQSSGGMGGPQMMMQGGGMGSGGSSMSGSMMGEVGFDGKMLRKTIPRKTVDFNPSAVKYLENRIWKRDYRDERALQADPLYMQSLTLPQDMLDNPVSCVTTKFIRAALNKDPRPVFCAEWTPDGRRLITGASSGEFTLWNGLTFNFETILQAHNCSVRSMIWSRNAQWMITGDDRGYIKYWQANMNNVKMFQGHLEAIRGLSFSPTDAKFTSCSDDRTVRIFDFVTCREENVLSGHGSDVKCVDWHPIKGLIVSGSKDSQQPIILWDARNAKKIMTLHAHKNTCTDLKWNSFNENWLVSSSKDHLCKLFDLRKLKEEVQSFRGHKKDVCTVAWHPIYEKLFVSGGLDGSMFFWHVGSDKELGFMEDAHEAMIWDLSWHPLGHILVSGSNDRSTRFWTRNRPGDITNDRIEDLSTYKNDRVTGIIFKNIDITPVPTDNKEEEVVVSLPGLGLDKDMLDQPGDDDKDGEADSATGGAGGADRPTHSGSYRGGRGGGGADSYDYDDDDYRRKKAAPYSKPIPKDFEKAWKSTGGASQQQADEGAVEAARARQIPSLLSNMNQQQQQQASSSSASASSSKGSSGAQPINLMDLMSAKLEPRNNKNNNYNDKKKPAGGGGYDSNRGNNNNNNFKKRRNENFNDFAD